MPSVLILSFLGTSFFANNIYSTLLSTLLTKATIHESLSIADATSYISSDWPDIILVTDPVLTQRRHAEFTCRLVKWVLGGGTVIFMGRFASEVEWPDLNALLQLFYNDSVKPWAMIAYSKEHIKIHRGIAGMRTKSLPETAHVRVLFLKNVRKEDTLYFWKSGEKRLCPAAFASIGFGRLGFVGNMEPDGAFEKIIIAMCRLDDFDWKDAGLPCSTDWPESNGPMNGFLNGKKH